jgi:23S rRNA pseudouridine955/2504/2580 synthase
MVTYIEITPDEDGQRLDNLLIRHLKGVPRQHVYKVIRSGEVRINGKRAKPKTRLKLGDQVRIPPIRKRQEVTIEPQTGLQERLLRAVLFESGDLLVLNKPQGVAVHAGSSIGSGLIEQLRLATGNSKLELVHRLDRETSGCLLLAKKPSVLKMLQEEFRTRRVKKIYQLIVLGDWPAGLRTVTAPLQRYTTPWGERRVRVAPEGQAARTDFEVIDRRNGNTWLQARLHTGRTHQIRVHASNRGHSIVGDDKYQVAGALVGMEESSFQPHGRDPKSSARDTSPTTSLLLHASRLHIQYHGELLKFEAPLPGRFNEFWQGPGSVTTVA